MPASTSEKLNSEQRCPECGKQWQYGVVSAAGLAPYVLQHRCEKCTRWFLVAYRVHVVPRSGLQVTLLGIQRMLGRDVGSLRDTLRRIRGITADEIDFLVEVARLAETAKEPTAA